jgi:hypothetical protein
MARADEPYDEAIADGLAFLKGKRDQDDLGSLEDPHLPKSKE